MTDVKSDEIKKLRDRATLMNEMGKKAEDNYQSEKKWKWITGGAGLVLGALVVILLI
ncbi:MAG: hypothetical protein OEZ22_07215 [Spirochaetia bacterium]|nr:hypothetical protein [Spirochaetia bacterium]